MPTTYAAYSNLTAAEKMPSSSDSSPRASVSSQDSATKKNKWHRFLDELKPIENPQEPCGLFTPLQPYPPREQKANEEHVSKSRKASQAYERFKVIVGGEKIGSAI